jgi:hypothetical protein
VGTFNIPAPHSGRFRLVFLIRGLTVLTGRFGVPMGTSCYIAFAINHGRFFLHQSLSISHNHSSIRRYVIYEVEKMSLNKIRSYKIGDASVKPMTKILLKIV